MKSRLVLFLLVLGLLFPAFAQAKPVLLLFHPGGFCFGSADQMDKAATYAKPDFQPVEVDYPLCTSKDGIAPALRYSINTAEGFTGRMVYAYGESAGGSIAARLAERGDVREAAVQSPVTDVVSFLQPMEDYLGVDWTPSKQWMQPSSFPSTKPIHAWVANDGFAPATWPWINADPKVTGESIPGNHLQEPYHTAAMHSAIDWLAQ